MGGYSSHHLCRRVFLAWITAVLMCGCNARKANTAASRNYTAFITRYNVYYNGDRHFSETLAAMESGYADDYSRLLYMHPAEAKADPGAPQPAGDFSRSIDKARKAINTRSIKKKPRRKPGHRRDREYQQWMRRDEYNPYLHNAWMLLGRSLYYNGDFSDAASAFAYVARHFAWLPQVVAEARLWQAQCCISMGLLYDGELLLNRVRPEQIEAADELRLINARACAGLWIRRADYARAIPYLREAIGLSGGAQKTRLRFLLGQLCAALGRRHEALRAFKEAASSPSATYRTKLNARIRQSEVCDSGDAEAEIKALRRMARYDRNKDYLDQIYYALGNLHRSQRRDSAAMACYATAVASSTRGGIDKAVAQIALGDMLYARRDYDAAQPCYSEALPVLPESYAGYAALKRRSDVLDELAGYSAAVRMQDSLLRLVSMPEPERLEAVDRLIEGVKSREREERERAERKAALDAAMSARGDADAPVFSMPADGGWYFYNPRMREAGRREFQKRWGVRKLEDDWRRANKSAAYFSEADTAYDAAFVAAADYAPVAAADLHSRGYYLAGLPVSAADQARSHAMIQQALYRMGVTLKDRLGAYGEAQAAFERLLSDYPDTPYRLDALYNLCMMHMRLGRADEAGRYRRMIIDGFPASAYARNLSSPDFPGDAVSMHAEAEALYRSACDAYLANANERVHAARAEAERRYLASELMPKFMFLDALAYVTDGEPGKFASAARELARRYPDADVAAVASGWERGLDSGLVPRGGDVNMRVPVLGAARTAADSACEGADSLVFVADPASPHLLVLAYDAGEVNANALLYEVARFNFATFMIRDFDLEPMLRGGVGMLVVRGFANHGELSHYRRVMEADGALRLPAGVRPVAMSVADFDAMLDRGLALADYLRYVGDNQPR